MKQRKRICCNFFLSNEKADGNRWHQKSDTSLTPQTQAWHHIHKLQNCSEPCDILLHQNPHFLWCIQCHQPQHCHQELKHTWYFQIPNLTPNNNPKKSKNAVFSWQKYFTPATSVEPVTNIRYEFIEICSRFSLVKWTRTFLEISQTTLNICHLTFFKGLVQSDRFYGLSICPICWVFPWANIIFLFWLCCDLLLFWRFITEMKTLWSWTIVSKIASDSKTFPR